MKTTSLAMIFIAMTVAPAPSNVVAGESILIRADSVHVGDGQILSPGQVLIRDGKIVEVGESISVDNAQVLTVRHLIPGLVDAASRAGISELDQERTKEITPELSTATIVDWTDREFTEHLESGTTTVHLTPGTDNVISGVASVAKTVGPSANRIVSARTGLAISMCSDPASGNRSRSRPDSIYIRQPTNRMGVVWMLRATFHAAKTSRNDSSTLQDALSRDLPIYAVSRTQYDIQSLLTLADEFTFQPIVIGGQESWQLIEELSARKVPVILQPVTPGSSIGTERTRLAANNPARLHEAKVPFCIAGGSLLNQARFAVRFGLPSEAALASITSAPASILKVNDRVGTIAAGKDADLVGLNGDPLEFTSAIQWVIVDGEIQLKQAGN